MLSTLLSIALIAAASPAAPQARIALAFAAGTSPAMRAAIVDEGARVWRPYGIALTDAARSAPPAEVLVLRVAILDRPPPGTDDHALGSIPYHDGAFDAAISLYAGTASQLVSGALESSGAPGGSFAWPPAYRDALLARVLGRALAHEVGHYLLQTRHHSASGLMRAVQPIRSLMEGSGPPLALTADEAAVVREWLCEESAAGVDVALHRETPAKPGVDDSRGPETAGDIEGFRVRIADHVEEARAPAARDVGAVFDQRPSHTALPETRIDEQRIEFGVAVRPR